MATAQPAPPPHRCANPPQQPGSEDRRLAGAFSRTAYLELAGPTTLSLLVAFGQTDHRTQFLLQSVQLMPVNGSSDPQIGP